MSETNSIDIIARRQQLVSRERDPRAWWIDDDPFESRKGPEPILLLETTDLEKAKGPSG